MKIRSENIIERFYLNNASLLPFKETLDKITETLIVAVKQDKKILVCGNGGSASDADHIVGELMKGFELMRPLETKLKEQYETLYGQEGLEIANKLQQAIPAISLRAHGALISAFENDVDPSLTYAQQVNGYGHEGDILIGISTSGNADNVNKAIMVGNVLGLETIGLTGKTGGRMLEITKHVFVSPTNTTFETQEIHLKVYHLLCQVLESEIFEE